MGETLLKIAEGLSLPLDLATQSVGVVAQRGAGKTYLAAVLIEELVGAGVPVCVLDPVGVLWGLRLGADGKERGGLDIVILGGERGDVPLEAGAGKFVAEWVVAERRSCVLDLSGFRKNEQRQFVTDFAEELYRRNRQPLHVVLDEADLFAPQRPMPGEQRMLGAFEDLVRRGRARGIGLTLITQRPAVIHKDVLTQVAALVALRLVGPQDVKAVDAWIQSHGTAEDRKRVLDSLPGLPIGEAWFWSPGWLGILKRVKVRKRNTFDSSRAPSMGDTRTAPTKLAPVDLDALRGRLADAVVRAKADDPKTLRARIVDLERAAKSTPTTTPHNEDEVRHLRQLNRSANTEIGHLREHIEKLKKLMVNTFDAVSNVFMAQEETLARVRASMTRTLEQLDASFPKVPTEPPTPHRGTRTERISAQGPRPTSNGPRALHGDGKADDALGRGGMRRMLIALAQRPHGLTHRQLGVRAGMSSKSGTFANYLGKLRAEGWIDGDRGGPLKITNTGETALGAYEPLPTGQALLEYWLRELGSGGVSRLLQVAADAYPNALSREQAATQADLAADSGTYANYLGKLRALELIEGRGEIRASAELFDE
jgi:hypothetical protein